MATQTLKLNVKSGEKDGNRQEIKWNEARPKRESFNGCFKNVSEGEVE